MNPQIQNIIVEYQSFIFDCDGVILDSNKIKSEAFARLAQPYGNSAVEALTKFHIENGGVSRFEKVRFLVGDVLGQPENAALVQQLVLQYGLIVREQLMDCAMCDGVVEFLEAVASAGKDMHVVSGGLESELRDVFKIRSLDKYFSSICGSPRTKGEIMQDLLGRAKLPLPALFFGDSKLDHATAKCFGCDFVFISRYTDLVNWGVFVEMNGLTSLLDFRSIGPV